MIQSSAFGKRRMVVPMELDRVWNNPKLGVHIRRHPMEAVLPKDRLCKPQSFEALVECLATSEKLAEVSLNDEAVRLARQLGPDTFKSIYFGFLVGQWQDLESMCKPESPESLKFGKNTVPAVYLLMAHFIAIAASDNLKIVANIRMRSLIRTHIRQMITATGSALKNYYQKIVLPSEDAMAVLGNKGYDYGSYVIFYVHPLRYEDMVTNIQPSALLESHKAEIEIRKIVASIGPAQEEPVRPKNRMAREPRSSDNHRVSMTH